MKKMNAPEMAVVHFNTEDVIATSTFRFAGFGDGIPGNAKIGGVLITNYENQNVWLKKDGTSLATNTRLKDVIRLGEDSDGMSSLNGVWEYVIPTSGGPYFRLQNGQ